MKINIVITISNNNVIGNDISNTLLWDYDENNTYINTLLHKKVVIMGFNTFNTFNTNNSQTSLNRINIVITSKTSDTLDALGLLDKTDKTDKSNVFFVSSLGESIDLCNRKQFKKTSQ